MIDGGRARLRDERWSQPRTKDAEKPRWWRESKVSMVATFCLESHDVDPMPDVPENLFDPLWLIPKINEIKAAKGGDSAAQQIEHSATDKTPETPVTLEELADWTPAKKEKHPRWSSEPLVRSVVATFEPYEKLGRLTKVEAYHRGFTAADAKAFVADGHLSNWPIQEAYFPDYTPVLDLLHALSYVYQAAQAVAVDMEDCWRLCQPWITWIWQGRVERVIAALDQFIAETINPATLQTLTESRD